MFLILQFAVAALVEDAEPFPTAVHQQLVRTAYTQEQGLSSNEVHAMAITRSGVVWAAVGETVARFDGDRWFEQPGPTIVTALVGGPAGEELIAGAADGVWTFAQGRWHKEPESPEAVIAFAAEPGGAVWALAGSGIWRRDGAWNRIHTLHPTRMTEPHGLLPTGTGDVLVATETGLFELMGKRKYWMDFEVRPGGLMSHKTRALARLNADHFLVATDKGLQVTNGLRGWRTITGTDGLPVLDLNCLAGSSDGTIWMGSDMGLVRWSAGRFTYLAGRRWLPDNRVTAIAPGANGSAWVGTRGGISHIELLTMSLLEKAAIYQKTIESRDRRHGFVTVMQLPAAGQIHDSRQEISDNDGLWTSMYIAAQSFRYGVTKSVAARQQASRSMQALLRLESVTGLSGFPARAMVRGNEPQFESRSFRSDPEWHPSPVEKDWYWKGDTSSDELDGHYFGWYVFSELAASEDERRQVRDTCKRVTDHILDNRYNLVDVDGKPTTWGVWAPEKLNDDPKWYRGRGLNSLEILSHLKVASRLVGDPRYEQAYRELIEKHHYAINALDAKTGVSHDNQLAFLSYYPLLQLEHDPGLRSLYLSSIRRYWNQERVEANPLWNFIFGASTHEPCDVEAAVDTLREMPLDLITWKVENSHRADLKFDPNLAARGIYQIIEPLRLSERAIHKWDANPFLLDGGNDLVEGDPTIWLLPFWMGRYHKLIE